MSATAKAEQPKCGYASDYCEDVARREKSAVTDVSAAVQSFRKAVGFHSSRDKAMLSILTIANGRHDTFPMSAKALGRQILGPGCKDSQYDSAGKDAINRLKKDQKRTGYTFLDEITPGYIDENDNGVSPTWIVASEIIDRIRIEGYREYRKARNKPEKDRPLKSMLFEKVAARIVKAKPEDGGMPCRIVNADDAPQRVADPAKEAKHDSDMIQAYAKRQFRRLVKSGVSLDDLPNFKASIYSDVDRALESVLTSEPYHAHLKANPPARPQTDLENESQGGGKKHPLDKDSWGVEFDRETSEVESDFGQKVPSEIAVSPLATTTAVTTTVTSDTYQDRNIRQAIENVELFESVGATGFEMTIGRDTEKRLLKTEYKPWITPSAVKEMLPAKIEQCEREEWSFILRPRAGEGKQYPFIQFDDCSPEMVQRFKPFAFAGWVTSYKGLPELGNGQLGLALSDEVESEEEFLEIKRRVYASPALVGTGVNSGANGGTRWPGTLNCKPKHKRSDGTYPRVTLIHSAPGRTVSLKELEEAGLLAPALDEPATVIVEQQPRTDSTHVWVPDYQTELNGAPTKADGKPDRSVADFKFALLALRGNMTTSEVESELMRQSERAQEKGRKEVENTVRNAYKIVSSTLSPRVMSRSNVVDLNRVRNAGGGNGWRTI